MYFCVSGNCIISMQQRCYLSKTGTQKEHFIIFGIWQTKTIIKFLDRYPTLTFSSIAATGFGLTSYISGIESGFVTRDQGAQRVLSTLQSLWRLPQGDAKSGISGFKGFYYHFLNLNDAMRYKEVELSSIDTGLLMAGVLSVQSYFDKDNAIEKQIRDLADQLYLRVDWNWMMNGQKTMSMGWHPERALYPLNGKDTMRPWFC